MRMLLIPTHGDMSVVDIPVGDFRAMCTTIGAAYIEAVRVGDEWSMAVDEEGRYSGKTLNPIASTLYGTHRHGQPILGAVLLGREGLDVDGGRDWVDTDPELARAFIQGAVLA